MECTNILLVTVEDVTVVGSGPNEVLMVKYGFCMVYTNHATPRQPRHARTHYTTHVHARARTCTHVHARARTHTHTHTHTHTPISYEHTTKPISSHVHKICHNEQQLAQESCVIERDEDTCSTSILSHNPSLCQATLPLQDYCINRMNGGLTAIETFY